MCYMQTLASQHQCRPQVSILQKCAHPSSHQACQFQTQTNKSQSREEIQVGSWCFKTNSQHFPRTNKTYTSNRHNHPKPAPTIQTTLLNPQFIRNICTLNISHPNIIFLGGGEMTDQSKMALDYEQLAEHPKRHMFCYVVVNSIYICIYIYTLL